MWKCSLDYFFGPTLQVRQLVEHAVIRGKDSIVFCKPPPGELIAGRTEVMYDLQVSVHLWVEGGGGATEGLAPAAMGDQRHLYTCPAHPSRLVPEAPSIRMHS